MIVGTVRSGETSVHDTYQGFHSYHNEEQEPIGSFEIFHSDHYNAMLDSFNDPQDRLDDGWYYWSCFSGCLPSCDPIGPFSSSFGAMLDADEFNPKIDWYFEEN